MYYAYILWASITFQLLSALLWFKSALFKFSVPSTFTVTMPDREPLGGNPLGGRFQGVIISPELTELAENLQKQGSFNKYASFFTAVGIALLAIYTTLHG